MAQFNLIYLSWKGGREEKEEREREPSLHPRTHPSAYPSIPSPTHLLPGDPATRPSLPRFFCGSRAQILSLPSRLVLIPSPSLVHSFSSHSLLISISNSLPHPLLLLHPHPHLPSHHGSSALTDSPTLRIPPLLRFPVANPLPATVLSIAHCGCRPASRSLRTPLSHPSSTTTPLERD